MINMVGDKITSDYICMIWPPVVAKKKVVTSVDAELSVGQTLHTRQDRTQKRL